MGKRFLLVLGVVVALLAAACGPPTDDNPRALDTEDVPFDLLAVDPVTTTSTSPPIGATSPVQVFFMGDERLVPVERPVSSPASVEKVLKALISGPTEDEIRRGLRTVINPGATVLTAPVEDQIATIDLSGDFFLSPVVEEQIIALAQTVFTATNLGGVVGVRFTLDGNPAEVFIAKGSRTSAPVGRAVYAKYAPSQ